MAAPTHPLIHIVTDLESIQPILLTEEIAGIKHHWAQDINDNVDRKAIPTILVSPYAAQIGQLQDIIAEFIQKLRFSLFDDLYGALPQIPIRIVFQATNTGAYIFSKPLKLDSGIILEF